MDGTAALAQPSPSRHTLPPSPLQPHLKLNAAMGCLARMPLPALRTFSFPHASLEPLEMPSGGGGLPSRFGGHGRHNASSASLASRASHASQLAEAWQPYLK